MGLVVLLATPVPLLARKQRAVVPPPLPCAVFPADNVWNRDISDLPVHPSSTTWIASMGGSATNLHMDFGSGKYAGLRLGIPYTVVPPTQRLAKIKFTDYPDESDPGPYPLPPNAPIEGGPKATRDDDRHVLVVQAGSCKLYELYAARAPKTRKGKWKAASGAIWDLNTNATRRLGDTSADAANLPILAGLVRYDEVAGGAIGHALRFTTKPTNDAYVWPARHRAGVEDATFPPMGIRIRLRKDYDASALSPGMQVITTAMQHYGMILADNGGDLYVSGTTDPRWSNDQLHELDVITAADFEVIDESSLIVDPDSFQTK